MLYTSSLSPVVLIEGLMLYTSSLSPHTLIHTPTPPRSRLSLFVKKCQTAQGTRTVPDLVLARNVFIFFCDEIFIFDFFDPQ